MEDEHTLVIAALAAAARYVCGDNGMRSAEADALRAAAIAARDAADRMRADLAAALARRETLRPAEDVARREAAIDRAEVADMQAAAFLAATLDDDVTRGYDELADQFYRATGIMAPGKDAPMEWGARWTDEERRDKWDEWRRAMRRRALAALPPAWREAAATRGDVAELRAAPAALEESNG